MMTCANATRKCRKDVILCALPPTEKQDAIEDYGRLDGPFALNSLKDFYKQLFDTETENVLPAVR